MLFRWSCWRRPGLSCSFFVPYNGVCPWTTHLFCPHQTMLRAPLTVRRRPYWQISMSCRRWHSATRRSMWIQLNSPASKPSSCLNQVRYNPENPCGKQVILKISFLISNWYFLKIIEYFYSINGVAITWALCQRRIVLYLFAIVWILCYNKTFKLKINLIS